MAMMMVELEEANGEFCLRRALVERLGQLGITSICLFRDDAAVGVVLEGWLFDPARSAGAVAEAFGASAVRTLHPVLQLAVTTAADEGGRDVEFVS